MAELPPDISKRLIKWRLLRYLWTSLHYTLGLTGTVASSLLAIQQQTTAISCPLPFWVAVYGPTAIAVMTFLQPGRRAKAYASAWRWLSIASFRFCHAKASCLLSSKRLLTGSALYRRLSDPLPNKPPPGDGEKHAALSGTTLGRFGGSAAMPDPVEIFFSYAHEDEALMDEVRRQLIVFDRQNIIRKWHDRLIPAGGNWKGQIDIRLRRARIVLLFISPHFFESDYCFDTEMREAMRRHAAGQARVIPVILRPCLWQTAPFAQVQAVPTDGKPITTWSNRDEGCLDAASRIMDVVRELTGTEEKKGKGRAVDPAKVARKTVKQGAQSSMTAGRKRAPAAAKKRSKRTA